jgi:hypothetical protein
MRSVGYSSEPASTNATNNRAMEDAISARKRSDMRANAEMVGSFTQRISTWHAGRMMLSASLVELRRTGGLQSVLRANLKIAVV